MKIDTIRHLLFPTDALQGFNDKEPGAIGGTPLNSKDLAAREQVADDVTPPSGVIVKLHERNSSQPVVYSMARKPTSEHDFVSFAVSAMRNYADEAERLKTTASQVPAESASPANKLWDVKKLASRFNFSA